jgi:superoxide reductase
MIKTDDWKNEKHVPVIDFPSSPKKEETFAVVVTVGKEIAHPNTTEHHIEWISLYFKPQNGNFIYEMGGAYFTAHGATTDGANSKTLHAEPQTVFQVKLDEPGTLVATSYCNIHGLWESQTEVTF